MSSNQQATETEIYQLKITLLGTKPPIWRRVQVPSDTNLAQLHRIIQIVMGWEDAHLHHFKVGKSYYGVSYPDDFDGVNRTKDEKNVTLGELASRPKAKFLYEYDFGDSWEHEILLEKILSLESGVQYPVCITGKRACPPEDCGGVWGYANLLEVLQDPKHPEYDDMREWIGGSFDPEAFAVETVNKALRRVI